MNAWDDPNLGPCCVKIYRHLDHRRQAEREWAALTLLAEHHVDHVPRPLWLDRDGPQPALGMTLLDGTPLLDSADLSEALRGMATTTRRIQAIPLTGLLADLERVDPISHCLHRITTLWPGQLDQLADDPLTAQMRHLLGSWEATGDRQVLAESQPAVLSRGDANLLNWLHVDGASRCVDFEFSGHGTRVFDAADRIEHISARVVPDPLWYDLLPDLGILTSADHRRFLAAQRTCALRWLAVLWRQRHQRSDEFEVQCNRVKLLQSPQCPWRV
jgi:hypothetical protein